MKLIYRIYDLRFNRIVSAAILIFIYYRLFRYYSGFPMIGCYFILILEIFLLLVRESWWNSIRYISITAAILTMAIVLKYGFGVKLSILLWPLIWVLGTMHEKYNILSIILAASTMVIILFMSYTDALPYETFLALVGLFLAVRSRRIRREAYHTSQLHLEELNEAHKELQQAHAELQEASVHSMRYAALEERTRLAHEIHDGIGHQLTSLIVQLQALEIMLPGEPEKAAEAVSQLLQISRRAMAEVRLAVREWSDDEMGLGLIALKGLISQTQARSQIQFNFIQDSEITEWPIETSVVLYRVLQETFTNILRHSKASAVEIRIKETDNKIMLSVADNGIYTEDMPLRPGFGMKGIMERCEAQGGVCSIIPEKPHGLRVEVSLPIERLHLDE